MSAAEEALERLRKKSAPPPLGTKLDGEKPRCDLLPPLALLGAAQVLGYGARKYAPGNWLVVPGARERYLAAALRHVLAAMSGEARDGESGLSHLDHAVCSLLFVSELEKRGEGAAGAQASRCAAQVERTEGGEVPWAGRPAGEAVDG